MSELQPLQQTLQSTYKTLNQNLKIILSHDPSIHRQDSAKSLLTLIHSLQTLLIRINKLPTQLRTKYFNHTYNAILYISDLSTLLRKTNYSFQTIKQLLDCILSMQANIILQDVKYLEKRTKLYLDIAHIYEQNEYLQSAVSLLDTAILKYKQLKAIHEMDPPLPLHVQLIISNNLKILKIMHIKYLIQSGQLPPTDWKKKSDQQFPDDLPTKLLSLIQCLRTQTRKQSNIFQKSPSTNLNKNFKQILLQVSYNQLKSTIDLLFKSLKQQKSKIQKQVTFKSNPNLTQQLINQQIIKKRQFQDKFIKYSDFKKSSNNFPIEYHSELIHYAYQQKNTKILSSLLQLALLRIQCRRIQIPYVNDLLIIASSTPNPNIPNGYQKIPIDLNQANLKIQLKKLRKKNQGKGMPQQKQTQSPTKQTKPHKDAKQTKQSKESKKNTKDQKDKSLLQATQTKLVKDLPPTQWQLSQINHKFVYMIIKKSMSPQNAVYKINIVMGDIQQGPVGYMDTKRIIIPYIQQDMNIRQSKLKQYKGIRAQTHMAPYIIINHSKTNLQDEQQKRNLIIDIKPLIGKNPMIPPNWGYTKIPVDLRQVPHEFLKNSVNDYIYLTYKTDTLFHTSKTHIKILNSLSQLQTPQTPSQNKLEITQNQKLLQLSINYNLDKLNQLFLTLHQCLNGKLGDDYFELRTDFLTHLVSHLWIKYLRNPLIQFDYVNQMRLNSELIDHHYLLYKQAITRCKPIFLTGFKILNYILVKNPNSDILLLSRINLQLLKLLQQQKQYQLIISNSKVALDRIRIYRDQYLTRGLKGNHNKLLPFSITCSNSKIKSLFNSMQTQFQTHRNLIRKSTRLLSHKQSHTQLTQQQLHQQQSQYLHYQPPDDLDQTIQKLPTDHLHLISLLSAIQLDTLNIYFRATLKHVQHLKSTQNKQPNNNTNISNIKQSSMDNLATSLKNKLNFLSSKNQLKNQKNFKDLHNMLIHAQKLPPTKPNLHWLQKKTIQQYNKNPYAMALLMSNFAAMYSQTQDKKYFIKQSLQYIKKCIDQQTKLSQSAIQNSIFIYSTLFDDQLNHQLSSSTISPFKQLYSSAFPSSSSIPDPPILISKTSTSITLKMPPFKHTLESKKKKKIKYMTLFGKPSANGVDVSVNSHELQGTGLKNYIDQVVTVTSLQPNSMYCFAVAPTNQQSQLQQIGKTSFDILTCNPLPILILASYLSKISYQINQYQIAYQSSKLIINEICQQSLYKTQNQKPNYLYFYKFKQHYLKSLSLLQIRSITQTLYIMALCQRRKLIQLKSNNTTIPPITIQQKQQRITNWLMLASLLNPCLTIPITSIPYLIPQQYPVLKALALTLIPPKWMTAKLKQLGIKVMQKVLKWGLQHNEINLSRRIIYKWTQRKWLMLGRFMKVQQKKQQKKSSKDPKQPKDQQPKYIDKYTRILIQKSPGQMQIFQDLLVIISQQYSDLINQFVQKTKQQITYYSQFVDNTSEELDSWNSKLTSKLQLIQYLKDPINNIKKIPQTSPYYLQYNCKLLKKALQISQQTDYKLLLTKSQQLSLPNNPMTYKDITLNKQIQTLIFQAIHNDIQWAPYAKNNLIQLQQKTGENLSKNIEIYNNYQKKMIQLTTNLSKMDSLLDKYKDFDYLNLWISQLYNLKATILILNSPSFLVKSPVKGQYTKVRLLNLQDLLKKKKQTQILDKQSTTYSPQSLKSLTQILKILSDAAYSTYTIDNFIKFQNILKCIYNLLTKFMLTPFSHLGHPLWQYFTFISLLSILVLKKIKTQGPNIFQIRYQQKQQATQPKIISLKLSQQLPVTTPLIQPFQPQYYLPELDSTTTKHYWFLKYENIIDVQIISSILAYTIQTLRLQNKYNLIINLIRDFSNITQHYYSLQFLPFMIQSQQKLIQKIHLSIQKQTTTYQSLLTQYRKKKQNKIKGQRQHKLTNQQLPYQLQFQQNSKKIQQSISLLHQHQTYLQKQITSSKIIIEQIKRDTNKIILKLKQQHKYLLEFADDQQHIFQNYNTDTKLIKNRKNALKDIIDEYQKIYKQLKNSKTNKNPLAQIQNRNQIANLQFTTGNYQKALQFWEDTLATIYKVIHPVNNYIDVFKNKSNMLINQIGYQLIILSFNLLYKISKYGSFKNLSYQYNCTKFAINLSYTLYQNNLTHPQSLLSHAHHRLTQLTPQNFLQNQNIISLTQLINSLQYFSLRIIDSGNSIQSLPLLNLYQHISVDLIKNSQHSIKSKLLKTIALASSFLISQSIIYLVKIQKQKDLPNLWIETSDQMKKDKGYNWHLEEIAFDNSKPWNDNTNKQAIEYIKKITLKSTFVNNYGLVSIPLFNYARGLILAKIYSQQIYDNYETNQLRLTAIQQAQNIMRDSLKKLSILHQHYSNLQDLQSSKQTLTKNQLNQQAQKSFQTSKTTMLSYLKSNGIQQSLLTRYQSEKSTPLKKIFRIQLMIRIRFSIYQTYQSRRLQLNSFYVLKNGLANLHRLSYSARKVQTGYDPEITAVPIQPPTTGKKEDKKAKKQQQKQQLPKQQINWQKQKQLQLKCQQSPTRLSTNIFWHIKLTFQIGKLMYQQNRFKTSLSIFQQLITQCKQYLQTYYSLFSQGYLLRCKLRLGIFQQNTFYQLITLVKQKSYQRQQFLQLVMDLGEIVKNCKSVELFHMGKCISQLFWEQIGMKLQLAGLQLSNPQRMYTNKQQYTQQQQQQIKKKAKKLQKKPGKQDKKPPKKQDPKKKKQQAKAQYKVQPLYKYQWWNLLQQQKRQFQNYILKPHPNYHTNNIYSPLPLQYIKSYIRHLESTITYNFNPELLTESPYIKKLIKIVQTYPMSGYYYLIHLYYCLAQLNKNTFLNKLEQLLSKNKNKKIKYPYNDLPLNSQLINLTQYSQFIFTNRTYLQQSQLHYKKLISLLKNNCLLLDNKFSLDQIIWNSIDNQFYLTQYTGRSHPKYYPSTQDHSNQQKLIQTNSLSQSIHQLQLTIKIKSSLNSLLINYSQLASKPFDPTIKIDQDITIDILEIDKQFKSTYPTLLTNSLKPKLNVTPIQLITYLSKLYRQSQFMTYSNPSLQTTILRCHRILINSYQPYKDKCVLNNIEYIPKKSLDDKIIQQGAIFMKSILKGNQQKFLYILGCQQKQDQPFYGRVTIQSPSLSKLSQKLYKLRSKLLLSSKKSQSIKSRDNLFYQKQLKLLLIQIGQQFYPSLTQLPDIIKINLTQDNLTAMIKILDDKGLNQVNKEINKFLRFLHQLKYKLKNQQKIGNQ